MPIKLLQRVRDAAVVTGESIKWGLFKKRPCHKHVYNKILYSRPTTTVYEMNDLDSDLNVELVTSLHHRVHYVTGAPTQASHLNVYQDSFYKRK
jgi:hypothetical protein